MTARKWTPRGNGYTCDPWDIGLYFENGSSLWVLWRKGQDKPVGHFEDLDAAMADAKRIEMTEQAA